ncbi:MAG: divergent polysaccharide deacetylase family protein [Reyranellales bacterium]
MAAGTGKDRLRRPRRDGLIAAYGVVLALVAACCLRAFGIGNDPAPVVRQAEASQTAAAKPSGSLKLPPRPTALSAVRRADFRALPLADRADLVEIAANGLRLPKISSNGWMPWIAFARRYDPEGPPARVGLLMINLGADEALTARAIDDLPGEVSFAFLTSTPDLPRWLQRARERGHESYLMLPVEDPAGPVERGIKPIDTSADAAENLRRLQVAMARGEGYVGFVVAEAGSLSQSMSTVQPLMQEIAARGLAIVEINPDSGATPIYRLSVELGVGYARSSSVLDYKLAGEDIGTSLDRLVEWVGGTAPDRLPRHAFGVMQPDAEAIAAVVAWRQRMAGQTAVSLVPIIGHFECRSACIARVQAQPAQLRP